MEHSQSLAAPVAQSLEELGARLRYLRKSRKLTLAEMASKLLVSINTVRALEAGAPGAAIGTLASALWVLGVENGLERVAPVDGALAAARKRKHSAKPGLITEKDRDF